jgi:hypothetical protein
MTGIRQNVRNELRRLAFSGTWRTLNENQFGIYFGSPLEGLSNQLYQYITLNSIFYIIFSFIPNLSIEGRILSKFHQKSVIDFPNQNN